MGWFWSKSSTPKDESQPTAQSPPTESLSSPQPQPQSHSQPLSREEKADAEFKKLWADLESDINQPASSQTQQPSSTSKSDIVTPPASIAPESLYPDTMSCRSAFDYAFFCQSLGGQFVNVYRYGELRSCSEHWENFWLCMKTRTFSDKEKSRIIRDHYRKKAIKYKTGPSSEDVWDVRMEPVKNPFQGDFGALEREMQAEEEAQERARHAA